ncbi:MAG: pilus assembly protein PilM, partial [Lachnospiraceae bacterium]
MPRKVLGFDINANTMKVAVCDRKLRLERYLVADVPENMIRDGKYISPDAMGDFIKETLREYRLQGSFAAISLPENEYYLRRIRLPKMTTQQLAINLPFEFHDYITGEPSNYVFDYRVLSMEEKEMELLAATTTKAVSLTYQRIMKRAGLKLYKLVPDVLGIQSILMPNQENEKSEQEEKPKKKKPKAVKAEETKTPANEAEVPAGDAGTTPQADAAKAPAEPAVHHQDYAVLSVLRSASQLHFFSNGSYEITRDLTTGVPAILSAITDATGCDPHLAVLMMEHNQDHILETPAITGILDAMATEIMRVVNFYNYNNPKNNIDRILYCGEPI